MSPDERHAAPWSRRGGWPQHLGSAGRGGGRQHGVEIIDLESDVSYAGKHRCARCFSVARLRHLEELHASAVGSVEHRRRASAGRLELEPELEAQGIRRRAVHARRALGGGGGEDEAPDQARPPQRDLLGDETADGEPKQIHLSGPQALMKAIASRAICSMVSGSCRSSYRRPRCQT